MADKDTPQKTEATKARDDSSKAKKVHVVDVSHPGKSAPSATSRPVIVGSGSYMKDPMVSEPPAKKEGDSGDAPSPDKTVVGGGKVIQPLGGAADVVANDEQPDRPQAEEPQPDNTADAVSTTEPSSPPAEKTEQDQGDSSVDSSESAVVDAVLGQVDEKGNADDDKDQANDLIKQRIQEKKYFVNVSKPKQSYGSLIVTIVSITVIIATIVVVADAYDIISLL